jgi:hypothetical protein
MGRTNTTVGLSLRPGTTPKKIFKIIGFSTGGFSVSVPYHRDRSGLVFQTTVDYRNKFTEIRQDECQAFSASDKVKLALHPSGWVHFSGEREGTIISGLDPKTKKPKGAGVQVPPLDEPIRTGPTANVICWGLHHFDDLSQSRSSDIVFQQSDIYFKSKGDAYAFDIYVFTKAELVDAETRNGRLVIIEPITLFGKEHECDLIVRELAGQSIFLGLMCRRVRLYFQSPSGYQLNGPSQIRNRRDNIGKGSLHAVYPMPPEQTFPTKSLDYTPE